MVGNSEAPQRQQWGRIMFTLASTLDENSTMDLRPMDKMRACKFAQRRMGTRQRARSEESTQAHPWHTLLVIRRKPSHNCLHGLPSHGLPSSSPRGLSFPPTGADILVALCQGLGVGAGRPSATVCAGGWPQRWAGLLGAHRGKWRGMQGLWLGVHERSWMGRKARVRLGKRRL